MDNTIYIYDDNGQEKEMQILLTCELGGNQYVLVYEKDREDERYVFKYDEEGNLEVCSDENLALIEEVVAAFEDEENEEA